MSCGNDFTRTCLKQSSYVRADIPSDSFVVWMSSVYQKYAKNGFTDIKKGFLMTCI